MLKYAFVGLGILLFTHDYPTSHLDTGKKIIKKITKPFRQRIQYYPKPSSRDIVKDSLKEVKEIEELKHLIKKDS